MPSAALKQLISTSNHFEWSSVSLIYCHLSHVIFRTVVKHMNTTVADRTDSFTDCHYKESRSLKITTLSADVEHHAVPLSLEQLHSTRAVSLV